MGDGDAQSAEVNLESDSVRSKGDTEFERTSHRWTRDDALEAVAVTLLGATNLLLE